MLQSSSIAALIILLVASMWLGNAIKDFVVFWRCLTAGGERGNFEEHDRSCVLNVCSEEMLKLERDGGRGIVHGLLLLRAGRQYVGLVFRERQSQCHTLAALTKADLDWIRRTQDDVLIFIDEHIFPMARIDWDSFSYRKDSVASFTSYSVLNVADDDRLHRVSQRGGHNECGPMASTG